MKKLVFVASCLGLIVVFLLARSVYQMNQAEKVGFLADENAEVFVREHSPTRGSDDAKVYLVEFLDPACETCAAFSPIVKELMDEHPGRVKLVIRYAPFHPGADQIVKILEAARRQDKYWETLDVMFRSQAYWASHHQPRPEALWEYLPMVGLDTSQLKQDMQDPAIATLIEQDMADARTLGVRKTPSFYVNGKPLQQFGVQPLRSLLEAEIQALYPD